MKKSTLALTALPVLRSTAVAMISVSPNFIWTCAVCNANIQGKMYYKENFRVVNNYKPECDNGLDPDPQTAPHPDEVCHTAEHWSLRRI